MLKMIIYELARHITLASALHVFVSIHLALSLFVSLYVRLSLP